MIEVFKKNEIEVSYQSDMVKNLHRKKKKLSNRI
jgi:hypothetical protein